MLNFTTFTKLFTKLGHTIVPICHNCLITIDHQTPIGCNIFLRASTASSHGVTAIKKAIKIFLLVCKWSISWLTLDLCTFTISYGQCWAILKKHHNSIYCQLFIHDMNKHCQFLVCLSSQLVYVAVLAESWWGRPSLFYTFTKVSCSASTYPLRS